MGIKCEDETFKYNKRPDPPRNIKSIKAIRGGFSKTILVDVQKKIQKSLTFILMLI